MAMVPAVSHSFVEFLSGKERTTCRFPDDDLPKENI